VPLPVAHLDALMAPYRSNRAAAALPSVPVARGRSDGTASSRSGEIGGRGGPGGGVPSPRDPASAPGEPTVPAYSLRHVLAGIPTVGSTQLTDGEVDALFGAMHVRGERDAVEYRAFVHALGGGFLRVGVAGAR